MTYYDNIIGDIKIYHYSEDAKEPTPGKENYYCNLREAWPVSIQESELSWAEDEPDAAAFDVQIQYKYWSRLSSSGREPARAKDIMDSTGAVNPHEARNKGIF